MAQPKLSMHRWTAEMCEQAARDAGRVRTEPVHGYEETSEAEIRAEYEAVKEMDGHTARELEQRFSWLTK